MQDVIIGRGEIGKSVLEVLSKGGHQVETYDIMDDGDITIPEHTDVLHICIPHNPTFELSVNTYKKHYKPEHVIIWSTVPIGTTKKIKNAVHSPVEGRHPNLAKSIRTMTRWIGYNDEAEKLYFESYFGDLGIRTNAVPSSDYTEALKLLSTTEYGVNLVYADYKKKVADGVGMPYEMTKQWNRDYNYLYNRLGELQFQKYVLDPPNGKIGGHCVVPNAEILHKQYPSRMTKMIKELQ